MYLRNKETEERPKRWLLVPGLNVSLTIRALSYSQMIVHYST